MLLNIPDSWLKGNIYIDEFGNVDFETGLTINESGIIARPNTIWCEATTSKEEETAISLSSLENKKINELKQISESKNICPLGDKRFKDTWLLGLSIFF